MNATLYLSYVMIGLLVLLALVCFAVPGAQQWLPGNRRFIMGAILLLYATVRFFRLRKWIKQNAHE
jgi:hypothetical protein